MPQFAEPVIPDESAYKADEIRNPVRVQYDQTIPGSRLASGGGFGRDDKLRHTLLMGLGRDYRPANFFPTYLVNQSSVRTENLLVQSRGSNQLGSLDQVRFFNVSIPDAGCTDE